MQQDRVFSLWRNPHLTPRTMLLEVHFVGGPEIHRFVCHQRLEFFLWVFCRAGSACAMLGRGLRSRKPNCRNRRWHCRTPRSISYCLAIQAASVLPSHRFPPSPTSRGIWRRTALMSRRCFSLRRLGRPDRSPSRSRPSHFLQNPAPNTRLTAEHPPATSRPLGTSCRALPTRHHGVMVIAGFSDRRISSCNPRMIAPSRQSSVLACFHDSTLRDYAQLLMTPCLAPKLEAQ